MELPTDREIYRNELADLWFDDDGILCSKAKNTPRTIEKQEEFFALVAQITKGKKVLAFSDSTNAGVQDTASRDYASSRMKDYFIAMAVCADSSMGKLIINTFMTLGKDLIPIQLFSDEKEALKWLKKQR